MPMIPAVITSPEIAFLIALFVAGATPMVFVYVRHDVRIQRLRTLDQFQRTMEDPHRDPASDDEATRYEGDPSPFRPSELNQTSSFEYVREKYTADLPVNGQWAWLKQPDSSHLIYIDDLRLPWWSIKSSWRILASSIPYVVISAIGFYVLLACTGADAPDDLLGKTWRPLFLTGAQKGSETEIDLAFAAVLTVAAATFLGAYLFSIGVLIRAVSTFDLSALTMARVTSNMVTAVATAVIVFRSMPEVAGIGDALTDNTTFASPWLAIAFGFGLVPDLAVNFMLGHIQAWTGGKVTNNKLLKHVKSASLEIIDGVDFFTRFRLQQANLFEVQNLAVANPIMLFVETPYGIYRCVDWVAQAQLCTVVGPERFLAMRNYNIRTIFDLERALLSRDTTSQMRRFVGTLMLTNPKVQEEAPWSFWGFGPKPPPTGAVGTDEFGKFVTELLSEPAVGNDGKPLQHDPDRTLKHFGRIILDDLHVHRLRDVWMLLSKRLKGRHDRLPDTDPG